MATPLPTNRIPEHCRCWMVRGSDIAHRGMCDAFSPNPDAIFCLADDPHEYELCLACEHLEVCHRHELVEALLDTAGGGDTPEVPQGGSLGRLGRVRAGRLAPSVAGLTRATAPRTPGLRRAFSRPTGRLNASTSQELPRRLRWRGKAPPRSPCNGPSRCPPRRLLPRAEGAAARCELGAPRGYGFTLFGVRVKFCRPR